MHMPSNAMQVSLYHTFEFLNSFDINPPRRQGFAMFDAGLGSWSFQRPEIHRSYR